MQALPSVNAAEVARVFNAKRAGKGKWRAPCPLHGGKHSGPLSIREGDRGVILSCFGGCDPGAVLAKVGLKWSDLFKGKPTPQIRRRVSLQGAKEALERQLGLVIMLQATDASKRRYWAGAEKRIRAELFVVTLDLDFERVMQERG